MEQTNDSGQPASLMQTNARIIIKSLDIMTVSETWLTVNVTSDMVNIPGYNLIRIDGGVSRGGGVAIFVNNKYGFDEIFDRPTASGIEHL